MKHNPNNRRPRSRGGKQRHSGGGGRNNFESNGPEVKVRGTAQQVLEKYLALANDAQSSGDRINAESYFQHAEHYHRVLNADGANNNQNQSQNQNQKQNRPDRQQHSSGNTNERDQGRDQDREQAAEATVERPQHQAQPENSDDSIAPVEDTAVAVDPAEQPQPSIADMIPPAVDLSGGTSGGDAPEAEEAPKPRRRRSRAKPETKPEPDEPEAVQV